MRFRTPQILFGSLKSKTLSALDVVSSPRRSRRTAADQRNLDPRPDERENDFILSGDEALARPKTGVLSRFGQSFPAPVTQALLVIRVAH